MLRKLLVLTATITIAVATGSTTAQAKTQQERIRSHIESYINSTRYRQSVMHEVLTPTSPTYRITKSISYLKWAERKWKDRNWEILRKYRNPPHLKQFMCIHHFEGSWNAATGNGYNGGLQMDSGFQSSYASPILLAKGTANNWTPLEQIWTAEQAFKSRGFHPWPNTAIYCHLL